MTKLVSKVLPSIPHLHLLQTNIPYIFDEHLPFRVFLDHDNLRHVIGGLRYGLQHAVVPMPQSVKRKKKDLGWRIGAINGEKRRGGTCTRGSVCVARQRPALSEDASCNFSCPETVKFISSFQHYKNLPVTVNVRAIVLCSASP